LFEITGKLQVETHCFQCDFANMNHYIQGQKENISEIRVYFAMLSNHTFAIVEAISVVVKTPGHEKI